MFIMARESEEHTEQGAGSGALSYSLRQSTHSSDKGDIHEARRERLNPRTCHYSSGVGICSEGNKKSHAESLEISRSELEEYSMSNRSDDEEELEVPLPLRSEEDWLHSQHHHGHCHTSYSSTPDRYHAPPWLVCQHPVIHHQAHTWHPSPHPSWCHNPPQTGESSDYTGLVSVNVPHFSLPPAGGVSQAQLGGMASGCYAEERRRGAGLREECRSIFITYSSDTSSDILSFAEFLSKQGFRPIIDVVDVPVNCTDISRWRDGFLKDPSTLIVIAISPKYKADVEGISVDTQSLHTKYIHSMMQNEFIQQGCLNFRFIPVIFLNASQEHVPCWLQNTKVYHWPHDSEDLLLRLLRKERYTPPPVAKEISVIIQPVPLSATTPTLQPL